MNYRKKFFLHSTTSIVLGGAGLIGEQASLALSSMGSNIIILDIDKKKGKSIVQKVHKNGGNANYIFFNCNNENDIKKNFLKIIKKNLNPSIFVDCSYPRTKDWKRNNFDQISYESLKKKYFNKFKFKYLAVKNIC